MNNTLSLKNIKASLTHIQYHGRNRNMVKIHDKDSMDVIARNLYNYINKKTRSCIICKFIYKKVIYIVEEDHHSIRRRIPIVLKQ